MELEEGLLKKTIGIFFNGHIPSLAWQKICDNYCVDTYFKFFKVI